MSKLKPYILEGNVTEFCKELEIQKKLRKFIVHELNEPDEFGRTFLHYAAQQGNLRIIESLLEAGALVNVPDAEGKTPLHVAATSAQCRALSLRYMLSRGADATSRDREGKTPLGGIIKSISEASEGITQDALHKVFLLQQKSRETAFSPELKNTLMVKAGEIALIENDLGVFKAFTQYPLQPMQQSAYIYRHVLDIFKQDGVSIPPNSRMWNLLIEHALKAHEENVLIDLIKIPGANINIKDNQGATLLHKVVEEGFWGATKILLDLGAYISPQDKEGRYPISKLSSPVVRKIFEDRTEVLRKNLQGQRVTTALLPPVSGIAHYTLAQILSEHTLFEQDGER